MKLQQLQSLSVINNRDRLNSIDVFRGVAILSVVLFHFNGTLPNGELGVDLFFVISGLLVSRSLINSYHEEIRINFFLFFLQRAFKILPSFFIFIILGNVFTSIFYKTLAPSEIIPLWDIKRYIFFYQNYCTIPSHWCFDHIWSLCVEEHFYIILPLLFIITQLIFKNKNWIWISVIALILSGIILKVLVVIYTNSKDTYLATHNRLDALAWGVLLSLLLYTKPAWFKKVSVQNICFATGVLVFLFSVYLKNTVQTIFVERVFIRSAIPFSFFLMLAGGYFKNFHHFKILKIIGYYSYNWYLWHPIFIFAITYYCGDTVMGLLIYIFLTFFVAVFFTVFIEEFFLKYRKKTIKKVAALITIRSSFYK
jgi:peptidoglycan/LPS O-acetylase OafA/YrhL